MGSATILVVLIAVIVAFWAGSRWRHNTRTWSDYRGAKAGMKSLRKLRWLTLKAALLAVAVTVVYLVGTGAISFASHR
jgi:ABC-type Fe3+ transport system permease subunit